MSNTENISEFLAKEDLMAVLKTTTPYNEDSENCDAKKKKQKKNRKRKRIRDIVDDDDLVEDGDFTVLKIDGENNDTEKVPDKMEVEAEIG